MSEDAGTSLDKAREQLEGLKSALADAQVQAGEDAAAQAKVAELCGEVEALGRAGEKAAWNALAKPMGILLLAAGVLGGAGAITSGILRRSFPDYTSPLIRTVGWATICAIVGILGLVQFRKVELPEKLLSRQTLGIWVFVAIAGVLTQAVGYMLYLGPYTLIPVTSLLIGVGVATLAFQTRQWLLAPAGRGFAFSLIVAALPQYSREVMGSLLVVAVGGCGLALLLGAPLEPKD